MKKAFATLLLLLVLMGTASAEEITPSINNPQLITEPDQGQKKSSTSIPNLVYHEDVTVVDGDEQDFQDRDWIGDRGADSRTSTNGIQPGQIIKEVRLVKTPKQP